MTENQRILAERYVVGSLIGRGGMADVYEGIDNRLGRKVAIKLLKSDLANDPSFEARFKQEAQASARMAHPTIVRVYDAGEEISIDSNGNERRTPYIVMEYVRGTLLRDLIHQGNITIPEALGYAEGVLTALEFSHRAGVVHRDIKSANIMITDTDQVKVMDFGIARAISDSSVTQAHTVGIVGTAQYFSPEQARGETVDARTDLYSTGVLLYEMLAGRPPFKGDTAVSVAYQHVSEAVIPPSTFNPLISAELDQVVLHALAKDRNDRYQSAEEFREHLLAADITPPMAGQNVTSAEAAVEEVAAEGDGVWASEPTTTGELPEAAATEELAAQDSLDEFEALLAAGGLEATATVTTVAEPTAAEPTDQVESPESRSEVAPVTPVAPIEAVSEAATPASQSVFNQPIAKTEAITTDTDPFGALGLKFDKDAGATIETDTTSTGSTKTKVKTPALQNPGVLWGVGSAAVVFMVGVVIWLLTVSLPNLNPNPGGIPVADVTGKVYQEAYDTLTAQKLLVDRQYAASETVAADTVIRTDPVAGTAVPENTTITVWVSLGKTQIDMPDLRGMNEKMATDLLAQTKLTLGEIVQGHSATVAAGQIIETDPPAGTKVAEGAVVNITISDGLVVVPDVTNYSISEAKGYLTAPDVALSVEIGTLEACDSAPAGTIVVGQSIGAGTAPAGSTIVLYVTCKP